MFNSTEYVGREYDPGRSDCFGLVREYYLREWGLRLPNVARPDRFWLDPRLDLTRNYRKMGFRVVLDEDPQIGDGFVMPLYASMNTHTGVICGDNQILHHLPGRLSSVDRLRPSWLPRFTIILRHPHVEAQRARQTKAVHFHEVSHAPLFRDPRYQAAVARALDAEDGNLRGNRGGEDPADP